MEENMNNIVPINENLNVANNEEENIKKLIYNIREKQVMLDSDVARLYKTETKYLNRVMKRNIERFPKEFCFQLTNMEIENLRCQFVTSSFQNNNYGGRRYQPYVYTEQGIAMLSGLIKNETAIKVSINIMYAFIEMRKFITYNSNVLNRLTNVEYKMLDYDKKFDLVFNELQSNKEINEKEKIFFEGQIYDAYELIIKIIRQAQNKVLIIDNYIDDSILEMLSKKNKNVEAVILTSKNSNIEKLDIVKFNKQYPKLEISKTNKFHDRFILIDNKVLYHCGASLKDLGRKCFAINKIEDESIAKRIIKII